MTALVIAEHDNASVKGATLNTVAAAAQCGGDVHVLIAGHNAGRCQYPTRHHRIHKQTGCRNSKGSRKLQINRPCGHAQFGNR